MNFSYYPVPHLNSSNDIICEIDNDGEIYAFDCEGRVREQCIMSETCWDVPSGCGQDSQLQVANFLKCWEGPDANQEANSDLDLLPGCLAEAGLSSIEKVDQCVSDTQRVEELSARMKEAKLPMMAGLGPDPGVFPHIFVNGVHQGNYSFVALTRTLCDALLALDSSFTNDACVVDKYELTFTYNTSGEFYPTACASGANWSTAAQDAADIAISAVSLPIGFDLADPKYVNVKAVVYNSEVVNLSEHVLAQTATYVVPMYVLSAFSDSFLSIASSSDRFLGALAGSCNTSGTPVSAGDFSNVVVQKSPVHVQNLGLVTV